MEGVWNYFLYQTLAINAVDELGHLLRIVTIAGGPCAPYTASPTAAEIRDCNSWLGPDQPGVTTADPTEGGASAGEHGRLRRIGRGADGSPRPAGRRGPGELEAAPIPGQRDLSKPQITPPARRPREPRSPDSRSTAPRAKPPSNPTQVLDYLLGP